MLKDIVYFTLFLILIVIIISQFTLMLTYDEVSNFRTFDKSLIIDENESSDISRCKNLTLIKTAQCLGESFNSIFNYVLTTPDYDYENFTQVDMYIRGHGGDCHESAKWFEFAGRELGFYSEYITFITGYDNTTTPITRYQHAVTIISDDTGYCVFDQGRTSCKLFEERTNSTIIEE